MARAAITLDEVGRPPGWCQPGVRLGLMAADLPIAPCPCRHQNNATIAAAGVTGAETGRPYSVRALPGLRAIGGTIPIIFERAQALALGAMRRCAARP